MADRLSTRLAAAPDAVPVRPGGRALEIGSGPAAAEGEILQDVQGSSVVAVDRSAAPSAQMRAAMPDAIASGRLTMDEVAVEDFALLSGVPPCDFAFGVGVLGGCEPEHEARSLARIAAASTPEGHLLIDGADPLRERPVGAAGARSVAPALIPIMAVADRQSIDRFAATIRSARTGFGTKPRPDRDRPSRRDVTWRTTEGGQKTGRGRAPRRRHRPGTPCRSTTSWCGSPRG